MNISALLASTGPLIGKDLLEKSGKDSFSVWKYCMLSPEVVTKTVGQHYLRLDRNVDGFARLSPSILREFYGYTIIGTKDQSPEVDVMAENLYTQIKKISLDKFNLTKDTIVKSVTSKNMSEAFLSSACAVIAGDIVYEMSHKEPRPEYSTGEMVRGSDLDLIIIGNGLDEKHIKSLDASIYNEKYMLIKNPGYQEELDYLIKDLSKVEKQMAFDTFEAMVACKILHECKFLYGNYDLFQKLKSMLIANGIPEKLYILEQKAIVHRKEAEIRLLNDPGLLTTNEMMQLYFTTEEKEEFF